MATSPTDLSQDFVKSGNRLITQPSSDALLDKARAMKQRAETSIKETLNHDTGDPKK